MTRQIVLDTETTGINPKEGHKIIEIGCVELVDRKLTGNHYHVYINPQREVEQEAIEVHGITNEFLADKPLFDEVAKDFLDYVQGAELVIHNAAFDLGFLNHELDLISAQQSLLEDRHSVIDTLLVARQKHPGQRNSLDALCKRYDIDNSNRTIHGALLDSEILASVYLAMTGGQKTLAFEVEGKDTSAGNVDSSKQLANIKPLDNVGLRVVTATADELSEHEAMVQSLKKASDQVLF